MTKDQINRPSVIWWRLPEEEQEPYRRAYLEEQNTKERLDQIIQNYFIQEAFHSAATNLAEEAVLGKNTPFQKSEGSINSGFSTMDRRKTIKYLILEGNITEAIRVVGTYFPTILDSQPLLLFALLRLNLIEMIREHKFLNQLTEPEREKVFLDNILDFVRKNMINKVTHSASLLKDLEMTMSLLCFNFDPSRPLEQLVELPPKLRKLFDLSLRRDCYRKVNRAILELNDNMATINYCGAPLEITVSDLQNLDTVGLYNEEDEISDDKAESDETILSERQLEFPTFDNPNIDQLQSMDLSDVEPEEKQVPPSQILRSQLERIVILWLATENRLKEVKGDDEEHKFSSTYAKLFGKD